MDEHEASSDLLSRAFSFVEDMSASGSFRVINVAAVSVLESLGDRRDLLPRADPFLGPKSKDLLREVDELWGR